MFEKEAEKYYESKPVHTYVDSLGFFHDLEGIKQAYIQGRIDEVKANEWQEQHKQLIEDLDNSKKRIEELEKEAEKYADTVKCEWENDTYWVDCRDKVTDAYLASAELREKRIAELEKENAELLEKLKNQKADYETYYKSCYNAQKKAEKQLTKAKELLERLLITSCNSDVLNLLPNRSEVLRVRVEAEKFLKGE